MDISGLLTRKYDILQENADSQQRLAQAQSGLVTAQTATEPATAAAQALAARGAGAAGFGQAAVANANASTIPSLAASEIGLRGAQSNNLGSESWLNQIRGAPDPNQDAAANLRFFGAPGGGAGAPGGGYSRGGGFGNILSFDHPIGGTPAYGPQNGFQFSGGSNTTNTVGGDPTRVPGFDTGTSMVPGKGSSKVDSVKAKLAPREAVLNEAAADHLGRSTIDFLNAIGAAKMGLQVPGQDTQDVSKPAKGAKKDSGQSVNNQTGDPPGYATGTDNVGGPPAPGQTVTSGTWTPTANIRALAGMPGVPRPAPPAKPPAYKAGTSNVQKASSQKSEGTKHKSKSSADVHGSEKGPPGPTLPPPGVMQALMSMGGGGGVGGMPGPGGPPPMPMQLPQLTR